VGVAIVVVQGSARLRATLPQILEDESHRVSAMMRELMSALAARLRMLDDRLRQYDQRIAPICQQDERGRRLIKVEGVGPLVATVVVGAIGNARQFTSGGEFSAWLGLVPHAHSSGNRSMLLGISKRGVICGRRSSTGHELPHARLCANATRIISG
jgi:transposase